MALRTRQLGSLMLLTLVTHAAAVNAQDADDALPPPPGTSAVNAETLYHLALVINYYDTRQVVPVVQRQGHYFVSSADLQRAGLAAEHLPQGEVNLSALPEVRVEYDGNGQRLLLRVPRDWLPVTATAFRDGIAHTEPVNGQGALINYDLYTSQTEHGIGQATLWHEFRYFYDIGSLTSTGSLRYIYAGDHAQQEGYIRYDTTLNLTNEEDVTQWSIGDVITESLSWSNSVRVGGIRYGRDFSLRPDLVTWPLPAFSGEAAVPTAVDLFIDGYRAGSTQLQPGPFSLTNLPYVNGSGNAVLVTTDALGRQVSTVLPFYVDSELLSPGLSDGAITLGALRRRYGIDNFDYGPAVGSGSWRYGLTDWLTLESHAEGAESLALGGLGSVVKLWRMGVVNSAWTQSQMRGEEGHQLNWGYQYNTSTFSLGTQHTRRDAHFGNLALYDYDRPVNMKGNNEPIASLSKRADQYSLSVNLDEWGNVGAAWIGVHSFDGQRSELLNISWSRNLWGSSSIYLAASQERQRDDWTLAMSIQIPFGERDGVGVSLEKTPDAGTSQRINYSHAMPTDGGFSWDMAWARQSQASQYQQASLGWRNNYVELQGGGYGERNMMTWWGEATGSLVFMDNQFFTANKINDAFVVISTDGYPDIPVSYENQPMGKTDKNGYLLVSGVSSYYPASYRIDALNLPADTRLKETEQRVALRRNSGYLVEFPMTQTKVASVILHDENGDDIPPGSQVYRHMQPSTVVGYDGIAWLENLSEVNTLKVTTSDGVRCHVTLTLRDNPLHQLRTYGPLTCMADRL